MVLKSTGEGSNQCEYRKIVEAGRVPRKDRIRASFKKLSRRILKRGRISVSSEKMVESRRIPVKGQIRASIEKTVSAHTEKGSNECEYRKMV